MTKRVLGSAAALLLAASGLAVTTSAAASPAATSHGASTATLPTATSDFGVCEWFFTPTGLTRYGDVNRNGHVNGTDAYLVHQLAQQELGIATFREYDRCADVDQSGQITERDAYLISRASAGFITLPFKSGYA